MITTQKSYVEMADSVAAQLNVTDGLHGYFRTHQERIWQSVQHFELFAGKHGDVLEIGPFYAYTPLALQERSTSYTVIEGVDPVVQPLVDDYLRRGIACHFLDLAEIFGTRGASQRLPLETAAFDTIICWETMEHFSFNPVAFVRELWRVMKPGAKAYLTVPNRGALSGLLDIFANKGAAERIGSYYKFADYEAETGRPFLGFHWREYTRAEFQLLFEQQGFETLQATHLLSFSRRDLKLPHRSGRFLLRALCTVVPSLGNTVALTIRKPLSAESPVG